MIYIESDQVLHVESRKETMLRVNQVAHVGIYPMDRVESELMVRVENDLGPHSKKTSGSSWEWRNGPLWEWPTGPCWERSRGKSEGRPSGLGREWQSAPCCQEGSASVPACRSAGGQSSSPLLQPRTASRYWLPISKSWRRHSKNWFADLLGNSSKDMGMQLTSRRYHGNIPWIMTVLRDFPYLCGNAATLTVYCTRTIFSCKIFELYTQDTSRI